MQGRLKLTKLILAGENKKDAIINFKGGLNVIAGASDTGKSFAFECIDFALGSSSNPKTVPEMKGYRSVFLEIEDIGQEEIFTLRRNFSEDEKNEIFIYYSNYQEKDAAEVEKLSVTHNAKKSLSKKLLNCCDCTYKYVMKNTKGDTQAFTFRSFSPLIMINELRITARHSPIYHTDSRGSTFATPARTAFKTVISGIDYKKEEKKENTEIIKAKLKGKIEQLSQIIDEIRIENNELIKDTEDINTEKSIEIIELNKFIKEKSEEIKKYELDYKEIQTEIRKLDADMERRSEKLAQAFMKYKEGELSKEAYIEMKDDRNNWKEFCEERKKSLEQTIRKLEKQQKEEARFLRSLLELDGTTRINAELAEGLIESMYLYGDGRLEINFGFKGAVEHE